MITLIVLLSVIVILLLAFIAVLFIKPKLIFDRFFSSIQDLVAKLPNDVLQSILRSAATRTGKLNELLITLSLNQYDKLLYFGEPIDFIGIDYNRGIDFIEVKTGKSALRKDTEVPFKKLVEDKKVNYILLRPSKVGIPDDLTKIGIEEHIGDEDL